MSSTSTPHTNLQPNWQKGISHVMSGTIFFICVTSAISAYFAALRISAWQLLQHDGDKDARTGRRREDRGKVKADDEPGLTCLDKFFDCAESGCVGKPGDTQGTLPKRLVKYRETGSKRIQSRRSVGFSRMAKNAVLDVSARRLVSTEEDKEQLNFLEEYEETRRFRNSEIEGKDNFWPHNLHFSTDCVPHGEGFLNCETKKWSQSERSNEKPRCERSHMGIFLSVTLQAAVHLGIDCTENLRSTKDQTKTSLRQLCFKWLRSWSLTRLKSLELQRLIGGGGCGERRFCWLAELFSLQLQKPSSFLTQCYVCDVSVLNQSKHEQD